MKSSVGCLLHRSLQQEARVSFSGGISAFHGSASGWDFAGGERGLRAALGDRHGVVYTNHSVGGGRGDGKGGNTGPYLQRRGAFATRGRAHARVRASGGRGEALGAGERVSYPGVRSRRFSAAAQPRRDRGFQNER